MSTSGEDADIGRRLALEIRLLQQHGKGEVYFLGKSLVYSAGVTFMAAFPAAHRFLASDCALLIHERDGQAPQAVRAPFGPARLY